MSSPDSNAVQLQQIDEISRRMAALDDELRPITERIMAGKADAASHEKNAQLQEEIAHLHRLRERLLSIRIT
jgi:hypothetical protein